MLTDCANAYKMADEVGRPSSTAVRQAFRELVKDPLLGANVRSRDVQGQSLLRSLRWKLCLNVLSSSNVAIWPDALRRHRRQWADLAHDYLRAPDGTWVEGARPVDATNGSASSGHAPTFDPLGSDSGNPWPGWYKDLELRKIIRQDVDRTFPDNDYFRIPRVQESMTNLLFVYAKLHIDVGYRQGMHEILAILFWVTDLDSLDSDAEGTGTQSDSLAHTVLSRSHLDHDAYAMFNVLMTNMLSWYDPEMTVSIPSPSIGSLGQSQASKVQPIVAKCSRIHEMLKKVDFELWRRMEELQIEPQIWGIKWLRLLFSREFAMPESLKLWDALFAEEIPPSLRLVDHVCLAMLLRIRESLLDADYSTFLQSLLRYPTPGDGDARVLLLVSQALYLQDNTTNFGGAYVRRQNQQLSAEAGVKSGSRAEEAMYAQRRSHAPGAGSSMSKQQPASTAALLDQGRNIAEGLYARSEALGINKALWGTLGELKKSVQAYQAQQPSSGLSEIPSRQPWEAEPAKNYALDLKRLRTENQAMGNALSASLQVLERQMQDAPPDDQSKAALDTMRHIRDVLLGHGVHFDPSSVTPMVKAATQNLLDEANPPLLASTSASLERRGSSSLIDDTSPGMPSTMSFPPLKQPAHAYSAAPPRAPSAANHSRSSSVIDRPISPSLPQVPASSHFRSGSISSASRHAMPDMGEWQAASNTSRLSYPLSSTSSSTSTTMPAYPSFPRMPPASRPAAHSSALHGHDGRSQPKIISPLTVQGPWTSNNGKDPDPLGVLF